MPPTSDNEQLLVVLGATGNQGGAVLRYFAQTFPRSLWKVRGLTRNPNSQTAKDLEKIGVEMVEADLSDLTSVKKAFQGATHIFATTDSNRHIFEAIRNPELLKADESPRSYARKIEMAQGQDIAAAAADTSTLQRIVWSSLASPKKWSHGRYTKVTMFDTKEDITDILASTPGLGEKLSVLLVGFYATNALHVPDLYGPHRLANGTYELSLPLSGDFPMPIADLDTDMGPWTEALFNAQSGTTLIGATEVMSFSNWLEIWARCNGVTATYRRADSDEFAAKIEGISEAVLEEFAFFENCGFAGGNPKALLPQQLRAQGVPLHTSSIEEQIRRCDWSSIL